MPIYAYKCMGCGHKFDKIQRISDAPLTDCPQCQQPELKKQITAAAFKLTGTGWYETDFKNKSDDSKSKDSKSKDDTSAKPAETKAKDTKSDTKTKTSKDAA